MLRQQKNGRYESQPSQPTATYRCDELVGTYTQQPSNYGDNQSTRPGIIVVMGQSRRHVHCRFARKSRVARKGIHLGSAYWIYYRLPVPMVDKLRVDPQPDENKEHKEKNAGLNQITKILAGNQSSNFGFPERHGVIKGW